MNSVYIYGAFVVSPFLKLSLHMHRQNPAHPQIIFLPSSGSPGLIRSPKMLEFRHSSFWFYLVVITDRPTMLDIQVQ